MNHEILNYRFYLAIGILAAMALLFLILGLRGLITNRPFVLSSRVRFALLAGVFLPNLFIPFERTSSSLTFNVGMFIPSLMLVAVLAVDWAQMRGFTIYGVSGDAFTNCLRRTLHKLQLPYIERVASIRLQTLDANLEASVQHRMGTAQLRIKPSKHAETLTAIANGLRQEFLVDKTETNRLAFIVSTLLGITMLGLAYYVTTFRH